MYKTLREVINEFEIRGKDVSIDKDNLIMWISDCQRDSKASIEIIEENVEDFNGSLVTINY